MKDDAGRLLRKIVILTPWMTILIAVPSFVLLIVSFRYDAFPRSLQYVAYALSFYALVILCTGAVRLFGVLKRVLEQFPLVRYFQQNLRFRTIVTMIPGALINALFVIVNLRIGIVNSASWFIYLGLYHLYLALMKAYLLHDLVHKGKKRNLRQEYKKYGNCGAMLLLLNVILIGESISIVHRNKSFHYDGMLIYLMAAVVFYNLTMAIINVVRSKKWKSPVLSAVKVINLTACMVSMLALETAMMSQFGSAGEENFRRIMASVTSGAVCLIEFVMAVHMIRKAKRAQK